MGSKTSKQINKDINNILSNYLCDDLCKVVLEYFDDINFSNINKLVQYKTDEINKLFIDCSEKEGCKLNIDSYFPYLIFNKVNVTCYNSKHLKLFRCYYFKHPKCLGIIREDEIKCKYDLYMCSNCYNEPF